MDTHEARKWLDAEWVKAIAENDMTPDARIDALANSTTVAIRYALVTQLLGKIADSSRNLLTLQLADSGPGAWDARSFATAVVVPWVTDNQQVLGTSLEPYASKPLRRERLERAMPNVRDKHGWPHLVDLLDELDAADHLALVAAFRRVLKALVRRLAAQTFGYAIPKRISLPAVSKMVGGFLDTPSGGLRPLAVTTALLDTIGRAFGLFSHVEAQGINEADAASAPPTFFEQCDTFRAITAPRSALSARLLVGSMLGSSRLRTAIVARDALTMVQLSSRMPRIVGVSRAATARQVTIITDCGQRRSRPRRLLI